MGTDGCHKRMHACTALPRTINVSKFAESRAPELEALHSIVSTRTDSNFRVNRNKRRRTAAHENQASRRRNRSKRSAPSGTNDSRNGDVVLSKLSRRMRRRLEFKKNSESGFVVWGDGMKRLRTHIWHAKRFTMIKIWGFYLPLGLHGRGRGSRAVLKRLTKGSVIHDSSYCAPILLEGSEESLMSVLEMVLLPSHSTLPADRWALIRSGAVYGVAMLYHTASPSLPAIAPVTYMWRPSGQVREVEPSGVNLEGSDRVHNYNGGTACRQIWMWVHAAALKEGYNALCCACQKISESEQFVSCSSLEGKLARLEIIGANACQILQKVIHPISPILKRDFEARWSSQVEDHEHHNSIFSLTALDPRILPTAADLRSSTSNGAPKLEFDDFSGISESKEMPFFSLSEGSRISDDRSLWNIEQVKIPVKDDVLCSRKNAMRMDELFIQVSKQTLPRNCDEMQDSGLCPILLLRNTGGMHTLTWWSVILPISWTKVFWIPFVRSGAYAIGLREKQWVACEAGLPCFPSDFPDSLASTSDLYLKQISSAGVPTLSPWSAVYHSSQRVFSMAESKLEDIAFTTSDSYSFPGFIARTLPVLTTFLNFAGGQIFPEPSKRDLGASMTMNYKNYLFLDTNDPVKLQLRHKLVFVRVFLRQFKEGVFQEGAVVCAPTGNDISLLTSCSLGEGLQIPQSSLHLWFTLDESGHWKYHIPDDPALLKYHRLPIGFVTTGFVTGSKKPVAEAFCDSLLLARLRDEQCKETESELKRKEIYVLVRNLRSSAFRLALANIVLETQDDDTKFI